MRIAFVSKIGLVHYDPFRTPILFLRRLWFHWRHNKQQKWPARMYLVDSPAYSDMKTAYKKEKEAKQ
jgi:endonuclease YncB( thermonuclease family)